MTEARYLALAAQSLLVTYAHGVEGGWRSISGAHTQGESSELSAGTEIDCDAQTQLHASFLPPFPHPAFAAPAAGEFLLAQAESLKRDGFWLCGFRECVTHLLTRRCTQITVRGSHVWRRAIC